MEHKGRIDPTNDVKRNNKSRVSLGVHSMPKTNEKSFKKWFFIGGIMLLIIIALFLILVI